MTHSSKRAGARKSSKTLDNEYVRIQRMMAGLTISWPMVRISRATLAEIEQGAQQADPVLVTARRDLIRFLGKVKQVQDFGPVAQAFEVYAEACTYLLLKAKGIALQRTPGTGKDKQKRPDFIYSNSRGSIYFEVKCLDFEGGASRH